jgi:acyl-CoA dehydrogenase
MTLAESPTSLLDDIRRIATEVAAPHANEVDRDARFPAETVDALRDVGALSALVPAELGGRGWPFETVADAAFELGRACSASAMVFAMHQIQVATIARHAAPGSFFADYLGDLVEAPRLIASVTSEIGTGGDLGRSIAALTRDEDGRLHFEKAAPTVSYGAYADDLLTTVRRSPDAEPGDQVLVLTSRDQNTLEPMGGWDPLGMRGTCSPGFKVSAILEPHQVLETPFARVATESMVPVTHLLWSHVWLGIATEAFDRARAFVRGQARQKPGEMPPTAQRLSRLAGQVSLLRAEVRSELAAFVAASATDDRSELSTMAHQLRLNNLKITASEETPRICLAALEICGIVGYRNDTPFAIGRLLRDALSGPLMIANERIHQTNAGLLLVAKDV